MTHSFSTHDSRAAFCLQLPPNLSPTTLLHLPPTNAAATAHQQQNRPIHTICIAEPAGRPRLRTTMCSSDIFLGFLAILFPPLPGKPPPPHTPTNQPAPARAPLVIQGARASQMFSPRTWTWLTIHQQSGSSAESAAPTQSLTFSFASSASSRGSSTPGTSSPSSPSPIMATTSASVTRSMAA